jgi:mannitol 2-dehydrogenase
VASNLGSFAPDVTVPTYDRTGLRPGIVHIGVGAFHRAHQAFYVDKLLSRGEAQDYAICGVGLLPGDTQMRDARIADRVSACPDPARSGARPHDRA